MEREYYGFGEWVIVDNDPKDDRQVIQYDVLNDEYTLDKNGVWDYVKSNRVYMLQLQPTK